MADAEAGEDGVRLALLPVEPDPALGAGSAPGWRSTRDRFLTPTLHFRLGPEQIKKALAETMRRLGVTRRASDRAVDAAYAAQRDVPGAADRGRARARWRTLDETGEPGLMLVGRGYNIYDRGVNCDIPRKLRHRYGANVIPLDFLVTGRESRRGPTPTCSGSAAARSWKPRASPRERPNLHLVYISNFKCGPDSYIKHFARDAAGAPLLVLQFDGHGNDAGYMTRCEAYLDSKGILRCYQSSTEPPSTRPQTQEAAPAITTKRQEDLHSADGLRAARALSPAASAPSAWTPSPPRPPTTARASWAPATPPATSAIRPRSRWAIS